MKAHFALLGIICVLMVATISLQAAYARTAPVPFPACSKVPSYYLKGAWIWMLYPAQDIPRKGFSFVKTWWYIQGWPTAPEADKKAFLSSGTRIDLYIDKKKQFLLTDFCYDADGTVYGTPDVVIKMYYVQYFPLRWNGVHTFETDWLWAGYHYYHYTSIVTFT